MNPDRAVICGSTIIPYTLSFSAMRKRISIIVHPNKKVKVVAPKGLCRERIQQIVQKKTEWIMKKIAFFDAFPTIAISHEYVNGETFLYLGRQYRLKINHEEKRPYVRLFGKYIEVFVPEKIKKSDQPEWIERKVKTWYRENARKKICTLLKQFSEKMGISPPDFHMKLMEKQWGSCGKKKILNFNIRIILAPLRQLEYVIAHELCHLDCQNHSPQFWNKLRLIMPEYQELRQGLNSEGWRYTI